MGGTLHCGAPHPQRWGRGGKCPQSPISAAHGLVLWEFACKAGDALGICSARMKNTSAPFEQNIFLVCHRHKTRIQSTRADIPCRRGRRRRLRFWSTDVIVEYAVVDCSRDVLSGRRRPASGDHLMVSYVQDAIETTTNSLSPALGNVGSR